MSTITRQSPADFKVDTIGDIERLNRRVGHHFFDADTLRFFSSRVQEPVIANRFFITTERRGFDDPARCATLRMVTNAGTIETIGEQGQFLSPAAARTALKKARRALEGTDKGTLAKGGVAVRFDPYPNDLAEFLPKAIAEGLTERGLFGRFVWRAYVGDLPIGSRTTRTLARQQAREAVEPCPCN